MGLKLSLLCSQCRKYLIGRCFQGGPNAPIPELFEVSQLSIRRAGKPKLKQSR